MSSYECIINVVEHNMPPKINEFAVALLLNMRYFHHRDSASCNRFPVSQQRTAPHMSSRLAALCPDGMRLKQ